MRRRIALALALTVLAGVAWLTPASAAEPAACDGSGAPLVEPVELCGVTTLAGSSAGRLRVRLPQEVTLGAIDIDVQGTGDFVGLALATDAMIAAGQALTHGIVDTNVDFARVNSSFGAPVKLKAGEYEMYLLSEGSPVQVTLRLEGLSGSVSLTPARPTAFEARIAEPRVFPGQPLAPVYTAGEYGQLGSRGYLITAMWAVGEPVAGTPGHCLYNASVGDDPPSEDLAFLPPCPWIPQSEYLFLFPSVTSGVTGFLAKWTDWNLLPGRWGSGGWYVSAGTLADPGLLLAWIGLS